MIDNCLNFLATCPNQPMSCREYIQAVRTCLRKLAEVDGRLATMYLLTSELEKSKLLSSSDPGLKEEILQNLDQEISDWEDEPSEGGGRLTMESRSPFGFSTTFVTTIDSSKPFFLIDIDVGRNKEKFAPGNRDRVRFEISEGSEFLPIARKLFEVIVELFMPDHASLWRPSVVAYPKQPIGNRNIGWLTYFDNNEIANWVPSDVKIDRFASGILIQTSEHPPYPTDDVECSEISRVFHALQPHGVLERPKSK